MCRILSSTTAQSNTSKQLSKTKRLKYFKRRVPGDF